MPSRKQYLAAAVGALAVVAVTATTGIAADEGNNNSRPLKINQTEGFFDGQNQVFTYAQNFQCVIDPFDDLDGMAHQGDGVPAAADPDEMVIPECIAGETQGGSEPSQDPAGRPVSQAREFFAIVPVFDADSDGIPETLDPNPGVDLQCPEPGPPSTEQQQPTGSCTMHPTYFSSEPILGEALSAVTGFSIPQPPAPLAGQPGQPGQPGQLPVGAPVVVPMPAPFTIPLPGHSHILDTENDETVWWQIFVNLVTDPSVWPDVDGNCAAGRDQCLTSIAALRASQATGGTGRDIPTNAFLFFANEPLDGAVGENAAHTGHEGH